MAYTPPVQKASAGSTGTVTTLASGTLAATPTNGNLLVADLAVRTTADPTITTPTGWTKIGSTVVNTSGMCLARFYKIAGASEPTSVTFSWVTTQRAAAFIAEYAVSGATLDSPVSASATGSSTTPAVTGAAATAQAHELEVAIVARQKAATTSLLLDGFANELTVSSDGTTTNICTVDLLDKDSASANTPGPGETLSATSVWAMAVDTFYSAGTTFNDSGSGTITLAGATTESASGTDSRTGTITLGGASTESYTIAQSGSGTVTIGGSGFDSWSVGGSSYVSQAPFVNDEYEGHVGPTALAWFNEIDAALVNGGSGYVRRVWMNDIYNRFHATALDHLNSMSTALANPASTYTAQGFQNDQFLGELGPTILAKLAVIEKEIDRLR